MRISANGIGIDRVYRYVHIDIWRIIMLRSRVKKLEACVVKYYIRYKELAGEVDEQKTRIKQLECEQTGHSFTDWRIATFWGTVYGVRATCAVCKYGRHFNFDDLKPARIKALLELGVLTKSDLPKPKPRKKRR